MPIDLRKLKPTQCQKLVNSTSLGTVLTEKRLRRIRNEAGYRISEDGHTIDLFKLAGLLIHELKNPVVDQTYEQKKEAARQKSRSDVKAGQDIGKMPKVKKPWRRRAAVKNLEKFYTSYFPDTFVLPWSDDHRRVIRRIEEAVTQGGLFALAMPRGNGKTVMTETACLWALLCGHREYVALIGSDESSAMRMLENIQTELECNDLLLDDFPKVCYPIRCLEGINQRKLRFEGKIIHMEFTAKQLILPTIPRSKASGSIVEVSGITGRIRGMNYKRQDLVTIRPSLVIIDDPQTDESARSPSQCATREAILSGTVLGLAGPGKKISGIMPCTVIYPGDLADRMLDRDTHPQWNGERTKMVYEWPTDEELWKQYAVLWAEGLRAGKGIKLATDFYTENLEAMDAGSVVAWAERKNSDELSAIQHAWNLRLTMGDAGFFAEYQNDPLLDIAEDAGILTAVKIAEKVNGFNQSEIPAACNTLTMFIDIHDDILYYAVCAWGEDFTGYIVDYGTFPEQNLLYFSKSSAKKTLALRFKGMGVEGARHAGLEQMAGYLLGQEWVRDDGAVMRIDRCLIDSGYATDTIHLFCRQSPHANMMPSLGRSVRAAQKPFYELKQKQGEVKGHFWMVPSIRGTKLLRTVHMDVNYWKTFIHARLSVAMGDPGCLSLFAGTAERHRMLAEHLAAEYRVRTEGLGRSVDEWSLKPNQDNHLLDCIVGCAVGASMEGVTLPHTELSRKPRLRTKSERVSLAEMRRRKREHV